MKVSAAVHYPVSLDLFLVLVRNLVQLVVKVPRQLVLRVAAHLAEVSALHRQYHHSRCLARAQLVLAN